jgi:signal peptidase II
VYKLLFLAFLVVVIDQISKLSVKGFSFLGMTHQGMDLYESHSIIGDFLRFTYVENPGMAFGLNFDMPVVLSIFSIAASIFLVYLLKQTRDEGMSGLRIALALILGGAVGNLIDRVFYGIAYGYATLFHGRVVDFIDFDIPNIDILSFSLDRFYVFNIADAAVTIGVVLLLIFYPSREEKQADLPTDGTDNRVTSPPPEEQREVMTSGQPDA